MTTPPLDLEAMAEKVYEDLEENLPASSIQIILSALRELANERDKLWSGQVDKKDAEIARLTQMGCDMEAERDMANAHAADLTELVEKIRRLFNAWNHNRIVDEALAEDMEQLLNESNEKGEQ